MAAYVLRACTPADEPFARRLHREAYKDVVTRQFGEWDDARQSGFFEEKWDPARYQVIEVEGEPAGIVAMSIGAGEHSLDEIQLLPEFQSRGIGTAVLGELQADASAAELPVRLRVLRLNRAKALYQRLGFVTYDETETHFLMEWLPPS
jgi:ribosomal protein S18 acetylase RimI-like enzyme